MHPLQRLFDPFQLRGPRIIKDAQCDQISSGSNSGISQIVAADNSRNVSAMKPCVAIVVRVVVHFSEVITADDLVTFAKSAAQSDMIERDAGVDDGNRLASAIKPEAFADRGSGGGCS